MWAKLWQCLKRWINLVRTSFLRKGILTFLFFLTFRESFINFFTIHTFLLLSQKACSTFYLYSNLFLILLICFHNIWFWLIKGSLLLLLRLFSKKVCFGGHPFSNLKHKIPITTYVLARSCTRNHSKNV